MAPTTSLPFIDEIPTTTIMGRIHNVVVHGSAWILVAWFVVAIACATRFWRITAAFRRNNGMVEPSSKAMRESLERAWERSPR